MKVLICGSREWPSARMSEVAARIHQLNADDEVIAGGARGVDQLAADCARQAGLTVSEHPADWDAHGRAAGFIRNIEMLQIGPQLVIAFQADESPGTQHTIDQAFIRGIKTEVHQ